MIAELRGGVQEGIRFPNPLVRSSVVRKTNRSSAGRRGLLQDDGQAQLLPCFFVIADVVTVNSRIFQAMRRYSGFNEIGFSRLLDRLNRDGQGFECLDHVGNPLQQRR